LTTAAGVGGQAGARQKKCAAGSIYSWGRRGIEQLQRPSAFPPARGLTATGKDLPTRFRLESRPGRIRVAGKEKAANYRKKSPEARGRRSYSIYYSQTLLQGYRDAAPSTYKKLMPSTARAWMEQRNGKPASRLAAGTERLGMVRACIFATGEKKKLMIYRLSHCARRTGRHYASGTWIMARCLPRAARSR